MNDLQQMKQEYIAKNPKKDYSARTIEMAQLRYKKNLSLDAIGKRYGVTRQRVHQILAKI